MDTESILVADDDAGSRRSLELIFSRKGYEVEAAASGQEALAMVSERFYNLALLDIKLPDMEGIGLLDALKKIQPDMVAVMITAYASTDTAVRALNEGAAAYLTKPLNVDQMLFTVREALRKQHLEMENRRLYAAAQQELGERKRMEAELRESEELHRSTLSSIADTIFIADDEGRFTFVSPNVDRIFGCSRREVEARGNISELLGSDILDRRKLESSGEIRNIEKVIEDKAGEKHSLLINAKRVNIKGGTVLYSCRDITDHKRAKDNLERSERQYRRLIEALHEGILITDHGGRIVYTNTHIATMLDYTPGEMQGKCLLSLVAEGSAGAEGQDAAGRIRDAEGPFELELVKKNGSRIWAMVHASPIIEQQVYQGAIYGVLDITEHKQLAEQLNHSLKMEAIGRLAGGIAHDFNNLLTIIIGCSDILLFDQNLSAAIRDNIYAIKDAGARAASLVGQLLAFSRKQVLQTSVVNLNQLIGDLEKMLRRLIGENIALTAERALETGSIRVDPGQLELVIMNLVINACQAMPEGGRITIETTGMDMDESRCREHRGMKPGRYALLAVSDTGHGMDEATRDHIFEPFYTTKEQGKGTGLGLSTAYGIVKQSGGYIYAESEPGSGTTMKIFLPSVEEQELGAEEEGYSEQIKSIAGSETILIAEDEDGLRSMIGHFFERAGYKIIEARNGAEALKSIGDLDCKEIDLLITDIVMPDVSGVQLARQLLGRNEKLRVLFISGYDSKYVSKADLSDPRISLVPKPFSLWTLGKKAREVLESKQ